MTTRWSRILRLDGEGEEAAAAWAWFVEIYAEFALERLAGLIGRAELRGADLREDVLPEFWSYAYERRIAGHAEPTRKFRPFLFGCLKNFSLEWRRRLQGHENKAVEVLGEALEVAWMRDWARGVIERALALLAKREPLRAEALRLFYGLGVPEPLKGSEVALRLGLSNIHHELHVARRGLRVEIEHHLLHTVLGQQELEEELSALRESLLPTERGLVVRSSRE